MVNGIDINTIACDGRYHRKIYKSNLRRNRICMEKQNLNAETESELNVYRLRSQLPWRSLESTDTFEPFVANSLLNGVPKVYAT